MKEIKNIIFDLGGVILNIDFQGAEKELIKLGVNNFNEVYSKAKQISLFDRFEEGKIDSDEFRTELKKLIGFKLSDEQIDKAWNATILDFPVERINFLQKIRHQFRIFLLSNTNEIHYIYFMDNFRKKFGYEFSDLFEKMYLSFQLGMRKPDIRIFENILRNHDLKPEETLFIDDKPENIETAERLGILTYLLKDDEEISKIKIKGGS